MYMFSIKFLDLLASEASETLSGLKNGDICLYCIYTHICMYIYRSILSVLEMPGQNDLAKSEMFGHFYVWLDMIQTSYNVVSLPNMYILLIYVCMCFYSYISECGKGLPTTGHRN